MQHRFTLEPYTGPASRYHCPECNSREKTFTRYIDTETGTHIAVIVGKCERLNKCNYHYPPKQFFADNPKDPSLNGNEAGQFWEGNAGNTQFHASRARAKRYFKNITMPKSYVSTSLLKASLRPGKAITSVALENTFIAFLIAFFGEETAAYLTARYFVGTSKHWPGATVFWQIDTAGRIRGGKIIQYGMQAGPTFTGEDCKRNKGNKPAVCWVHTAAKLEDFNLSQCLFGEHLLKKEPQKPVGIVESEKTAIIASAYLPEYVWLAVGGLDQLSVARCKAIAGRSVTLFPDLKGFARWEEKSRELAAICHCSVSDLLERKGSEADRESGLDLADFLLRTPLSTPLSTVTGPELDNSFSWLPDRANKPPIKQQDWNAEIEALEIYFASATLPADPLQLSAGSTIANVKTFLQSHFATLRGNAKSATFAPYLSRLDTLKQILQSSPSNGQQTAPTL